MSVSNLTYKCKMSNSEQLEAERVEIDVINKSQLLLSTQVKAVLQVKVHLAILATKDNKIVI